MLFRSYVDGEPSATSVSFNLDPSTYGPSLWLDSTDIDGDGIIDTPSSGSVASWNDKSGNNHHASQLNNASKPTLTPNSISGISALNFDGADSLSADTRFELGANPDIIVFAVVNDRTNVADGRIFLLGGSSLSLSCGTGSDGWAWRFDGGNEMYSSQSFDSPNLVVWQRTADSNIADSKFYLNGTEQARSGDSNPTSSPTSTTNKFVIGANSGANGNFFSGSIGEIQIGRAHV